MRLKFIDTLYSLINRDYEWTCCYSTELGYRINRGTNHEGNVRFDGQIINMAHTHTSNSYPFPSAIDIESFFNKFNYFNQNSTYDILAKYSGEINVMMIQFGDYEKFYKRVDSVKYFNISNQFKNKFISVLTGKSLPQDMYSDLQKFLEEYGLNFRVVSINTNNGSRIFSWNSFDPNYKVNNDAGKCFTYR